MADQLLQGIVKRLGNLLKRLENFVDALTSLIQSRDNEIRRLQTNLETLQASDNFLRAAYSEQVALSPHSTSGSRSPTSPYEDHLRKELLILLKGRTQTCQ